MDGGRGGGSLAWVAFSSALPPTLDSIRSRRLDLVLRWSPIAFGMEWRNLLVSGLLVLKVSDQSHWQELPGIEVS